jgi:taurine dioxygenase
MAHAIRRLSPVLGAEISGVDLALPISDAVFHQIRQAWHDHDGLLVIHGQRLTAEQHLAFSRRFGPLFGEADQFQESVLRYLHPDHPGIFRVSNKVEGGRPLGRARAGNYWHSDVSFREHPAAASLLYAIEIPASGGDTMFANMYRAYETLSEGMQRILDGVRAVHDFAVAAATSGTYRPDQLEDSDFDGRNRCVHPVVIGHPETGRKALFVNPGFTAGLHGFAADESAAVLRFLFDHATRPEVVYRHRWAKNDLVVWDNRCLMHYAVADYDGVGDRYMHRATVIAARPR